MVDMGAPRVALMGIDFMGASCVCLNGNRVSRRLTATSNPPHSPVPAHTRSMFYSQRRGSVLATRPGSDRTGYITKRAKKILNGELNTSARNPLRNQVDSLLAGQPRG